MTREKKQEFTLRISRANETELVVILYEMLLCYLEDAKQGITQRDDVLADKSIGLARACLTELLHSLHMNYEPASNLAGLYHFCMKRLAKAQAGRQLQALEDVRRVIEPLKDAYQQIAPQNLHGPVMGNSQEVYVGLTYGRNTLTENMTDQGTKRGMYI